MNKKYLGLIVLIMLSFFSCNDDFLNVSPRDFITDDAVWSSGTATKMFVNDVYNTTFKVKAPLYSFASINNQQFDNMFTDDAGWNFRDAWNTFNFTASNAPFQRWDDCYANIRKTNIGIEKLAESEVISASEKNRYLGDLHFIRGMLYFELLRFYGGVPLITEALDRNEDDIFYSRNTAEETFNLVIADFQTAAELLPVSVEDSEYGRATKGAALGMLAEAYLHCAGTIDSKYYANAAATANIFINGELSGKYWLYGEGETDPLKKREAFQNLFLQPYEGNEEVIFDVQYEDNKLRSHNGYQTIAAPGVPGVNKGFGWGNSAPSQNLVDQFEMKDGSAFDWNNPEQAADPYVNRDERFYATVLYHGVMWKGAELSLSSNRFDNGIEVTNNLPNGLNSTKKESTKSGYYIRKHQWEDLVCGGTNRAQGIGDGGNLIVLRYAEILLIYAEAKNEVSGPDASVYAAINQVRSRAGQPDLPVGLSKDQMREKIRNERRVELCFENKRFFDIVRWNIGDEILNQPLMGMNARYVKESSGEIKITYTPYKIVDKVFSGPKNNLLPIPQSAMDQNPKLIQNPGW